MSSRQGKVPGFAGFSQGSCWWSPLTPFVCMADSFSCPGRLVALGRRAGNGRVLVELDFGEDTLRLLVSDDGVGLPEDYAQRGHGFANMGADAGRLGGRLVVEPRGPDGGARVTCVMPLDRKTEEV